MFFGGIFAEVIPDTGRDRIRAREYNRISNYTEAGNMNAIRMEIIVNELSVHKNVNVSKLAEKCGVSSYTIRRDLSYLENMNASPRNS